MIVVITAGSTQEVIGPLLSVSMPNMGWLSKLVAQLFMISGCDVKYIHGPNADLPSGRCSLISVTTSDDLRDAIQSQVGDRNCSVVYHGMSVTPIRRIDASQLGSEPSINALETVPNPCAGLRELAGNGCVIAGNILVESGTGQELVDAARRRRRSEGWNFAVCESVDMRERVFVTRSDSWDVPIVEDAAKMVFMRCQGHLEEIRPVTW